MTDRHSQTGARLAALRNWMDSAGLDVLVVPRTNIHQSEDMAIKAKTWPSRRRHGAAR